MKSNADLDGFSKRQSPHKISRFTQKAKPNAKMPVTLIKKGRGENDEIPEENSSEIDIEAQVAEAR